MKRLETGNTLAANHTSACMMITVSLKSVEYFCYGASKGWSEIIFLKGDDTIECLRRIISTENYRTKFVFEALNELIKIKKNIYAVKNRAKIQKINNIKIYHDLKGSK